MRPVWLLVAVVALAGCLGGPAVENQTGRFEWTLDADGTSATYEYDWRNDAGWARVAWDLSMAEGQLTLEIVDAAGSRVATNTFEGGSSGDGLQTQSGRSGTWHVTLEADQLKGPVKVTIRSA